MTRKLKQEANILLFPEGTSTNGEKMLPFQTVPLAAPLRSRSIIVPVTIAYKTIDERRLPRPIAIRFIGTAKWNSSRIFGSCWRCAASRCW